MKSAKEFEALTSERSQFLVRDYNDVTMRYVVQYPGKIDREILSQAVKAVVMSVDVLHGGLYLEKGKLIWKIYEDLDECVYFRHETVEELECAVTRAALEPIAFEEPVKLCCTLVQDEANSALVLRVSHLVCDGGDSKYLLGKIIEAYNLICKTGSSGELNVKNGSRNPAQVYAHLSRKEQKGLWKNPMSGPKNEFPFADPAPGEPRLLRRVISRQVMDAARQRGKEFGATANDLLLTACYRAFAATPGVDQSGGLCVAAMMDLRRHCPGGDSTGLTNLAGALSTVLTDGVRGTYEDTLVEIVEQTARNKKDPQAGLVGVPLMHWLVGKLPVPMLLKAADMVYGSMALGVTNMGNLKGRDMAMGELVPEDALVGGPRKKKPGVQVSVLSLDGACSLVIAGDYTETDLPELERFLDRILAEIEAFTANT